MFSTTAIAQSTTPPAPPPTSPPTREQIQPSQMLDEYDEAARRGDDSDAEVDEAPCPLRSAEYAELRFTLRDVVFNRGSGAEAIDTSGLERSWQGYANREIPVATICQIRDRAAAHLRNRGYLAAVLVPEQTIADGTVRFDIISARISRLQIYGNAGASSGILARYLAPIQEQQIFNSRQAERHLLLAQEIPGIDARLSLRPTDTAGELLGNVTVRRRMFGLDYNSHNFGTPEVGRQAAVLRLRANGLTGLGDQTHASLYTTWDFKEQVAFEVGHEMRLGNDGFRVGGRYSQARTRPAIEGEPIISRTRFGTFFVDYPLVLRQHQRVRLASNFDFIRQETRFNDIVLNRDKLRIVSARMDFFARDRQSVSGKGGYNAAEPLWQAALGFEARRGLSIFGASRSCVDRDCEVSLSRGDANPQAFVLRGNGALAFRPIPRFAVSLAIRGQWANSPLPAYEEFSVSNFTIGRGYDPGAAVADSGIAGTVGLSYGTLIPPDSRRAFSLRSIALQPYVFYDIARVWDKNAPDPALAVQQTHSAGGGVRFAWGRDSRFDFSVAVPLRATTLQPETGGVRILFTSVRRFAW